MTMIKYFCVLIEAWSGFKYQNPTRLAGYQKQIFRDADTCSHLFWRVQKTIVNMVVSSTIVKNKKFENLDEFRTHLDIIISCKDLWY